MQNPVLIQNKSRFGDIQDYNPLAYLNEDRTSGTSDLTPSVAMNKYLSHRDEGTHYFVDSPFVIKTMPEPRSFFGGSIPLKAAIEYRIYEVIGFGSRDRQSLTESEDLARLKEELESLKQDAVIEDIETPGPLAFVNAAIMIDNFYRLDTDDLMIELLPDSGIAVTRPGTFGCSLMVVCDSDGKILVSLCLDGEYQRTKCSSMDLFDVCFIKNALNLLKERENIESPDNVQADRR